MKACLFAALLCLGAGAAAAQEAVVAANGALLRGLDKIDGNVLDLSLGNGEFADLGRLKVELRECRYPQGAADAYAYLVIREAVSGETVFDGWMIASSPALSALEHPRYDLWVLRCRTD